MELSDEEILKKYSTSGHQYKTFDYRNHNDHSHWPCSVLKQQDDGSYIVRIHQPWWLEPLPWDMRRVPRLLVNYPREAIHFFVVPYETDQQMPTAFRHAIGIPDEMLPAQWKR